MPSSPPTDHCAVCGRPLASNSHRGEDGEFCSPGCETIHTAFPAAPEASVEPHSTAPPSDQPSEQAREYFTVDGLHSAAGETFLETRAEHQDGVYAAEASYVTETIRVTFDPRILSVGELEAVLSPLGYTAYHRSVTEADAETGLLQRKRDRGLDELLGYRYAIGVIFGTFMLLPYLVLLYPIYLTDLIDPGRLGQLWSASGFTGATGLVALPMFAGLTGVVLVFTGMPLLRGAYVSLRLGRPTTDLLVTITIGSAYVYGLVAIALGRIDVYFDLTIVIAAGVVAAIFYESLTKQRALDRLTDLTISQVTQARVLQRDGSTDSRPVADVTPGDRVLVQEGERIPVDGELAEGRCTVDEAVVTGESLPVLKSAGDALVGGSVVTSGAAVVNVGAAGPSGIDRLTMRVWDVQSSTHGIQRQADRFAGRLVPVLGLAALLVGVVMLVVGWSVGIVALSVLVVLLVGCPWALGLATPLSIATSLEEALQAGIVVFDETVFERLRAVDVVVFDKTGTLTRGEMRVVDADAPDEVLTAAARVEQRAAHPAAHAITTAFHPTPDPDTSATLGSDESDGMAGVRDFETHATGVSGRVDGSNVLVGRPELFEAKGWTVDDAISERVAEEEASGQLPVLVGRDEEADGVIVLGDAPRPGWEAVVSRLADQGREIVVLTGDSAAASQFLQQHPGIDQVVSEVPPEGKTAAVRRLQADRTVAMVGDGSNDAPALAQADLGISLGSGTALALDAADLAIVADHLDRVPLTFELAQQATRRVRRNNLLAFLYNGIALPIAVVGLLNPLLTMAAALVTGGGLAVNSFRGFRGLDASDVADQ